MNDDRVEKTVLIYGQKVRLGGGLRPMGTQEWGGGGWDL